MTERIFRSEKPKKLVGLVKAINNSKIKNAGYRINKATASDTQGNLTSDLDTVTHTSNGILDQKLLSFQTIREVSVLNPLTNPTIRLTSQTLLMPTAKEIFVDATSVNKWINRNPRRISRTGVDGSIPISTPIQSGMSKSPTLAPIESTGTRGTGTKIPIGTTDPPCGLNVSSNIDNVHQSNTQNLRRVQ